MTTSADISIRSAAFELNLKTTPRLVFPCFRLQVVSILLLLRCAMISLILRAGLLAWVFFPAQWAAIPGISAPNAAGAIIVRSTYLQLLHMPQPQPS